MSLYRLLQKLYLGIFGSLERLTQGWFIGLAARFSFLAVLYFYFLNSARTKFSGFLQISDNTYYQIVPRSIEAAGGDVSQVGFIDHLMVYAGSYAEIVLPTLVVIGLLSRAAALGMIAFILIQSVVDITAHGIDAQTAGAWFDRFSDSLIYDQRLLWGFVLLVIVLKGPGKVSLDYLLSRVAPGLAPRG